jgi:hypothetical protein
MLGQTESFRPLWGFVLSLALVAVVAGCAGGGPSGGEGAGFELDPNPTAAGACASVLTPLSDDPPTVASFEGADEGIAKTIELAGEGEVARASEVFFTSTHDLTHDIDGPLQQANEPLKIALCNEVLHLEEELSGGMDGDRVRELAVDVRELLRLAREALGLDD